MRQPVTRFAPSPTGFLHLGHAFSALFAHDQAAGGRFLLRLEDIDPVRCKPQFEAAILQDLAWLGLTWHQPVRRQSDHMADYGAALDRLTGLGLIYPCFCSRKDIEQAGNAPHGPEGMVYPGLCKGLSPAQRDRRMGQDLPFALRLDMDRALGMVGPLVWYDRALGPQTAQPHLFGDVVLARKDVSTSYHLAVTVDDAIQGVTLVTRGHDLFQASHVHRLLQALLDLPTPDYHHHGLLTDSQGRRYAKRDQSLTLRALRQAGHGPDQVRAMLPDISFIQSAAHDP